MTRNQELQTMLIHLASQRQVERFQWRLVSALEAAFRIPQGDHLVCVLGEGSERNNREALHTWLQRELQEMEAEMALRLLPQLTDRLERVLTDWETERRLM